MRSIGPVDDHGHTAARAERRVDLGLDRPVHRHGDAVVANDHREGEVRLHESKLAADALAGTATEGQVGVAGSLAHRRWREALGVEARWLVPEVRMAMGHVGEQRDCADGADPAIVEHIVGNCLARERPHRQRDQVL
jgi:hypothetical protein